VFTQNAAHATNCGLENLCNGGVCSQNQTTEISYKLHNYGLAGAPSTLYRLYYSTSTPLDTIRVSDQLSHDPDLLTREFL